MANFYTAVIAIILKLGMHQNEVFLLSVTKMNEACAQFQCAKKGKISFKNDLKKHLMAQYYYVS